MLSYNWLVTIHLATENSINSCLTSVIDKTHPGVFYSYFSYAGCVLRQQFFQLLLLLICCDYPDYSPQRAFVIIFCIYSDLFCCLRNIYTVAIRTENGSSSIKVISTKKIVTASSHFNP